MENTGVNVYASTVGGASVGVTSWIRISSSVSPSITLGNDGTICADSLIIIGISDGDKIIVSFARRLKAMRLISYQTMYFYYVSLHPGDNSRYTCGR